MRRLHRLHRLEPRVAVLTAAVATLAVTALPAARSAEAPTTPHSPPSAVGKSGAERALRAVPAGVPNGGLFPVTPVRVADTRSGADAKGPVRRLAAGATADFALPAIPAGAVAAALNVTVVAPDAAGFLTLFPTGGSRPVVSNLNFGPGQIVPNLVQVKLGANSSVSVFNGSTGGVDVIVDLLGHYAPGGAAFRPIATRFTDRTMNGGTTFIGTTDATVSGRRVEAYALNLTVDRPTDDGWLAVRPPGPSTGTSNVNFRAGQVRANTAITGLGDAVDSTGRPVRAEEYEIAPHVRSSRVVVDEMGVFFSSNGTTSGNFVPLEPCRLGDTRPAPDQRGNLNGRVTSAGAVELQVIGQCGLPTDPLAIDSIAVNVTAVDPSADGFVRLWRPDRPEPSTSSVNFPAGQTVANHAIVETSLTGTIGVRVATGDVHLVFDVFGYYSI